MHMLSINVTKGQHVNAGDVIGISDGDPKLHKDNPAFTGFSGGAHLHFQVAKGKFYDFPYDIEPEALLGLAADGTNAKQPPGGPGTACFPSPAPAKK